MIDYSVQSWVYSRISNRH